MKLHRPFLAGLVLAALFAGPAAHATEGYTPHKTALFSISLPTTFSLVKSSATSWTYRSKNGHYWLRITAHPLQKQLAAYGEKILGEYLKDSKNVKVLEKKTTREDDRDIFYAVVRSHRTHGGTERDYLTMRLLTQSRTLQKLVSITLSVSGEKIDAFGQLVEHILDSLTFAKK